MDNIEIKSRFQADGTRSNFLREPPLGERFTYMYIFVSGKYPELELKWSLSLIFP